MPGQIDISDMKEGYEFAPARIVLDRSEVAKYIKATGETSDLYRGTGIVPPMAVAANAMASLGTSISLPPGSVHVGQVLEFLDTASIGDTLVSISKVTRNQKRGKLHMLTVDMHVHKQDNKPLLFSQTSFILPQGAEGR